MADEGNPGARNGSRASISADELRRDERQWVARVHRDAGEIATVLAERSFKLAAFVETLGPDRCRALRREHERFTALSVRLLQPQFADLR